MWQSRRRRVHAKTPKTPKKGKNRRVLFSAARWLIGFCGTAYLAWLLLFPALSGSLGRWTHDFLIRLLGGSAYFIPLFLVYILLQYFAKDARRLRLAAAGSALSQVAISILMALFANWIFADPISGGGAFGQAVATGLAGGIGTFGVFALSLGVLLFSLQLIVGIRWSQVFSAGIKILIDDYRSWQKARQEMSQKIVAVQAAQKAKVLAQPQPQVPVPAPLPLAIMPASGEETKQEIEKNGRQSRHSNGDSSPVKSVPPPPGSPYAGYQGPPLDLLLAPPPDRDRGKPSAGELAAAGADLERTLKDFGVEARVVGCLPGPVITRYELSPAPGVKVSSIVSLENDIALSLRAKGIRIIAPIPGKAAVGIEIPNPKPAMVVLRDILESPAIPQSAPPLTFALGLSADGEPKSADLQKMPHLLVAGATNSGKSVALHSLVMSILLRQRPDEVKFLMIDPKRLEMTFYEGIPHLFDPTVSCDKASVITNSKDAAKSLLALVKLMEKRYEKFQLASVRNIDAYNLEADKKKQPREFFVVVVIDELADLMLIAQDSVEDSIQRLTQMARAVGIHLVLATQRPSVDVITGVIKANLPARIALQVISRVDSKVILDGMGAESLQGRGDLLYLAAGAQRPERCQGAYVSEDEIKAVVKHLKTQGKPDYPMLETMATEGIADLSSFGVEPLEFSQALKLVIERRRVSQDLLKSQFGSSARATNLLSLLEVKQMIYKPEGSNRWEIHFDLIEDYLRKHFPQVPINGK